MNQQEQNEAYRKANVGYTGVLADVRREYGITLQLFNTGGGCMVFEGRLENGDFICVTEGDDFISPHYWRTDGVNGYPGECDGNPWGWTVLVYRPDPDEPDYRGDMPYAGVFNTVAYLGDLTDVVGSALRAAVGARRTGQETYITTDITGTRVSGII